MKTFVLSAVSIVMVGILFCPMAMSAPSMPDDLQMVQPDPSLPKELASFWGKWEGNHEFRGKIQEFSLVVEKIDQEKTSLYTYRPDLGWVRYEGTVSKEKGQYKLSFLGRTGWNALTLKGEYLDLQMPPRVTVRLRRVP